MNFLAVKKKKKTHTLKSMLDIFRKIEKIETINRQNFGRFCSFLNPSTCHFIPALHTLSTVYCILLKGFFTFQNELKNDPAFLVNEKEKHTEKEKYTVRLLIEVPLVRKGQIRSYLHAT